MYDKNKNVYVKKFQQQNLPENVDFVGFTHYANVNGIISVINDSKFQFI